MKGALKGNELNDRKQESDTPQFVVLYLVFDGVKMSFAF